MIALQPTEFVPFCFLPVARCGKTMGNKTILFESFWSTFERTSKERPSFVGSVLMQGFFDRPIHDFRASNTFLPSNIAKKIYTSSRPLLLLGRILCHLLLSCPSVYLAQSLQQGCQSFKLDGETRCDWLLLAVKTCFSLLKVLATHLAELYSRDIDGILTVSRPPLHPGAMPWCSSRHLAV